jgi:hypothetical protein
MDRSAPRRLNRLLKNAFSPGIVTSAAKAGIQNRPLIAAVNRCATQKQTAKGVFQQTVKPHKKHGQDRS